MNKNTIIIIVVVLLIFLIAALMLTVGLLLGNRAEGGGDALYELALQLYEDGDYERARAIIDEFLLQNPRHRRAIAIKQQIEEQLAQNRDSSDSAIGDSPSVDPVNEGNTDNSVASVQTINPDAERVAAEARINNVDSRDTDNARKIEQLLTDGSKLLARNQTDEARQKLKQVLDIKLSDKQQSDGYDSIALARTAEAYRLDAKRDPQNYARAQNSIAEAKTLDKNNWESYYIEGLIAVDQNRLDDAVGAFITADQLRADNPDVLFALATAQFRKRLLDDAEVNYRKVLSLVPDYFNAHRNLGITLGRKGETVAAQQVFEQGVGYYPDDPRLNYRLGIVSLDLGRASDAERYLKIAIRQNPQNATYHGKLGDLYFNAYDIRAAQASYQQAAQLAPGNAALQYNLAVSANISQDYSTAKRAIDIALRSDPNSAAYNYTSGQILDGLGKNEDALAAFQQAVTIDRNYPEAISELGRLHIETGNSTVGLQFLERAYSLKPNSPEVNNTIGNAYLSAQAYDKAIDHFTNAINLQPDNNGFRYNFSLAYIELKQYSKALEQLQTVLDADANYWDAYLKIGVVHIARGENDSARAILNQLLQKNPDYYDIDEVKRLLDNI